MWFAALEGEALGLPRKPHGVASLLDTAMTEFAPCLRNTEAQVHIDASVQTLPSISADKIWMKEATRNVIENAVKFNTRTPRQVTLSGAVQDGMVQIRVADNGPGIPPEERTKIFQKFYQ